MICPHCKEENKEGFYYCSECGSWMPDVPEGEEVMSEEKPETLPKTLNERSDIPGYEKFIKAPRKKYRRITPHKSSYSMGKRKTESLHDPFLTGLIESIFDLLYKMSGEKDDMPPM